MHRRTFLLSSVPLAALAQPGSKRLPIASAVEYSMLPSSLSIEERFQLAKDSGFERIECPTTKDQGEAERMKKAAERAGIKIHSVMNMDHWKYPLSSADASVVEKSLEGARISLHNAHLWGADTVLIVPGVVNESTSYQAAYKKSQESLRKLIPLAQELKVVIAVEEVWNKFLLSPLEFATYVDSFQTPWVRAYFDVGNVVLYGYPQDWIRTLGRRIVKMHMKDFSFRRGAGSQDLVASWVNLGEGDINWPEIHSALAEVGYKGTATLELAGGDAAYLKDAYGRLGRILDGTMPDGSKSKR
jgi:L-ribulose-5-phosphate 3-epimerase